MKDKDEEIEYKAESITHHVGWIRGTGSASSSADAPLNFFSYPCTSV